MTTATELSEAYVACGKAIGFANAELILMKYLPEDKLDGFCVDVLPRHRPKFLSEMYQAIEDKEKEKS